MNECPESLDDRVPKKKPSHMTMHIATTTWRCCKDKGRRHAQWAVERKKKKLMEKSKQMKEEKNLE